MFNEFTRVQIPSLLHLTKLGYQYIGKPELNPVQVHDEATNIIVPIFEKQFRKLNPNSAIDVTNLLADIRNELDFDDLGKQFYQRLTAASPKLIDFDHPENNEFSCTAEFTCKNGEEEFRPDITVFVNGLPLVFIEVKKPNNKDGMIAESQRMNEARFPNRKFRRFINLTQLMLFSNNMEYATNGDGVVPVEGVFYCTAARKKAAFNCFREENPHNDPVAPFHRDYPYQPLNEAVEKAILMHFNVPMLKDNAEFQTNCDVNTPTNRVLTSMLDHERLLYLLRYGIAYLHTEKQLEDGTIETRDEKHIMRYQQFFASRIIRKKIDQGTRSGIIWHTQGSGKTALSYHLSKVLKNYFAARNQVARFYFIVDRLDLLNQASEEFAARGLQVVKVNSKKELMAQFKRLQSLDGNTGADEITVVNIQKFEEDADNLEIPTYSASLQRVFIMDEAHRGYKPNGCFLANLFNADKNAIRIALTGTPLIGDERSSCQVFGNYYHTYYYDRSIKDGYTLKIIREEIETSYREQLNEAYDLVNTLVQKGKVKKHEIIEHESYVRPLLNYIIHDLTSFRQMRGDNSLGGMVICETSEQARQLYRLFDEVQSEMHANLKAGLILCDSDDKETLRNTVAAFKKKYTIDMLIVFNMLLTGFDAPRLKRLYFGRKLKDHTLLQAITRVNRPYKDMKYGYVIDFADIKQNFDETNAAYLRELNRYNAPDAENGDSLPDMYQQVMEDKDELIRQMKDARQLLFSYNTANAEVFSTQISSLEDKSVLIELRRALELAKDAINLVRTFGDDELKAQFEKLNIEKLPLMLGEINRRIAMINAKEALANADEHTAAVNEAMMHIEFSFNCISKEELQIIDGGSELETKYKRALRGLLDNFDKEDPEYITLEQAFREIFQKHGFQPNTVAEYNEELHALNDILQRIEALKRANEALIQHYDGDLKFAYVHKRIREENMSRQTHHENPIISFYDADIVDSMMDVKRAVDEKVYNQSSILKKDAFFNQTVMKEVAQALHKIPEISPKPQDFVFVQSRIAKQYLDEYHQFYDNDPGTSL